MEARVKRQHILPEDPAKLEEYRTRFFSHVDVKGDDDCWLWNFTINPNTGYGCFTGPAGTITAHRIAYALTHGTNDLGMYILHSEKCISRACCNPSHLRAGTASENSKQAFAQGTLKLPAVKLNKEQVLDIVLLYAAGAKQPDIAKQFNISQSQVSQIVTGLHWQDVTGVKYQRKRYNKPREVQNAA